MKKLLLLVLCLLLAFYVGWPMWSAYRIHAALEANDARALESKVDFPSVRASLKPVVTAEVERVMDKAAGRGLGQILGGALKQQVGPQLVETILNGFVTPKQIAELYARRGDIREILAERIGKRRDGGGGGGGRDQPEPETKPDSGRGDASPNTATAGGGRAPRQKFGFRNVKRLAFTGPLAFEIGVARDTAAASPDLTAQLGFTGFDWKLVGLTPRPR